MYYLSNKMEIKEHKVEIDSGLNSCFLPIKHKKIKYIKMYLHDFELTDDDVIDIHEICNDSFISHERITKIKACNIYPLISGEMTLEESKNNTKYVLISYSNDLDALNCGYYHIDDETEFLELNFKTIINQKIIGGLKPEYIKNNYNAKGSVSVKICYET